MSDGWMLVDAPPEDNDAQYALLHDGRILRVGRQTSALFDPDTSRWTDTRRPAHANVRERQLVTTAEGWVHASGGVVDAGVLAACELYKPQTDEWFEMPALPEPRRSHAAVVARGRVFVIGGNTADRDDAWVTRQRVFSWTPGETEWTRASELPRAIESCEAMVLGDDSIVAWGAGSLVRWDHEAWTSLGDVSGASAFVAIDDAALLQIGGLVAGEATIGVRGWTLEAQWRGGIVLPAPRKNASSVRLHDGRIAVVGGAITPRDDVSEHPVNDVLLGSAASGWQSVPAPSLGRCTAIVLPDGRVFVRTSELTAIWTP